MRKETNLIILLAAIKFVLPFLLQHPSYELHRDEYLYYAQGQHLDFGFLENPSLIGLLGWISSLLGRSFFWVKFWPSLFGALTLAVTAGIVKELGGNVFAILIASLGILLTGYLRVHFLFQPNFLEIFFWTLGAYYLLRLINTQRNKYFYLLSFAFALSWWSKYSVLFFLTSAVVAVLLSPHRKLLANKHCWWAILLGILLTLPNVLWQYQHEWPLAHHMQELQQTQLQYRNPSDFLKEQILMLLPALFVWISGLIWLLQKKKFQVIALTYLFCVTFLLIANGKGYYTLGTYPMLLAAGGMAIEKWSLTKPWLKYAATVSLFILALPFLPILMPMQTPNAMAAFNKRYNLEEIGLLKWEDLQQHALQQDFADMLGWKEMTAKTENFYQKLPTQQQADAIVYCRTYGQAGALNYYANDESFKKKIICDNGTFLLWIPKLHFKHLIFVGHDIPKTDDTVFQQFKKVTVIDSVSNPLSRQYGDKLIFFENANDSAARLANEGLKEMKAVFGE